MNYTVNTLANLSSVSVRTLRFYDEIGLLKPAFIAENGYRYYGQEQLLWLQQILFFRELGFGLKLIQKILESSDFNRMKALQSHKIVLQKNIKRMQQLVTTVDTTINHLEGKLLMKDRELFNGFDPVRDTEKQKEYEQYLIKTGETTQEYIDKVKHLTKEDGQKSRLELDEIHKELVNAIEEDLAPESSEVQKIISRHCKIILAFGTVNLAEYGDLGQLYLEHPDFKKMYDTYHHQLAEFLAHAMKVYAKKH